MAILKGHAVEPFLKKPPRDAAAVLIYGPDPGTVRERAQSVVRNIIGRLDDPFNVVRLDEAAILAGPGGLADEYNALSMMGGKRVIWVSDADKAFCKAVEPLLAAANELSFIVAESGNLPKTSALRALFEKGDHTFAIPCYPESGQELHHMVRTEFEVVGATIEPGAERLLISLLSADRQLSRSEVSKLALYAMGGAPITVEDVTTLCGDVSGLSVDDAIDAVFEGDLDACDRALMRLGESGIHTGMVLSMTASHVARLQKVRLDVDRGQGAEEAVRALKPPIFFKRIDSIVRQVGLWESGSLANAGSSIAAAVLASRQHSILEEAITSRALLALARNARQQRVERY